jgi:hypothetical protein
MSNIPTEKVKCEYCGKIFARSSYELKRTRKIGRRIFCSLSCSGKQHFIDYPLKGNPEFLIGHYDNRRDEYSPFRWFLKVINNKNRKRKKEINLEYLKEIWENQNGICPYTGWKLVLPCSTKGWKNKENKIYRASLDRIDCSKGYIEDNVQYISYMANIAKCDMTYNEMFEFCEAVVKYNK